MAHRNARLTEFGRLLLVQPITELDWPPAHAAEALGCRGPPPTRGRPTTANMVRLAGRPQLPPSPLPHALSVPRSVGCCRPAVATVRAPIASLQAAHASLHHLWGAGSPWHEPAGPHRPDQRGGRPLPARAPRRVVPIDVKKLGRLPDGGGHRVHGRADGARGRGLGYDDLHSAVDDRSRVAFSQLLPDERAVTAAGFLVEAAAFFADHGVRIQRVLTDNAKAYTESIIFAETAAGLGIGLKRTRRYRPQTNGKLERFNRTLLDEGAYARRYRSNRERRRAFRQGCGPTITADHTPPSTA
jgi:transposase InsO family protein